MDESILLILGVVVSVGIVGFLIYFFVFTGGGEGALFLDDLPNESDVVNGSMISNDSSFFNSSGGDEVLVNNSVLEDNGVLENDSYENLTDSEEESDEDVVISLGTEARLLSENIECLEDAMFGKCPKNDYGYDSCIDREDQINCSLNINSNYFNDSMINYNFYISDNGANIPYDLKRKAVCLENCYFFGAVGQRLMEYDCFGDCVY